MSWEPVTRLEIDHEIHADTFAVTQTGSASGGAAAAGDVLWSTAAPSRLVTMGPAQAEHHSVWVPVRTHLRRRPGHHGVRAGRGASAESERSSGGSRWPDTRAR